ncbi:MAG: ParB/RepB/Spo0J family partition protein [Phycisphaerae bacterium]|nr:ParB/RepB/Spo0J family partition protein [Phycisphaerae bacterium]
MAPARDQRRLGKGLSALIQATADAPPRTVAPPAGPVPEVTPRGAVRSVRCTSIRPNPFQPRADITPDALEELAKSIGKCGLVQPILVRPDGDGYQLIAGERRWRAAQLAGLTEVPAIVRAASDEEMLELALIENIFREDLNAIDRAKAYRRYCDEFGLNADQVAGRLGENRTTVTNYLRLLDLPRSVQEMVQDGRLSMGHARALAGIDDREKVTKLAQLVIANSFSVRAMEELVRKEKEGDDEPKAATIGRRVPEEKRPHIRDLEQQFVRALGTKVEVHESRRKGAGRLVIHYYTLDDFDRVAERLGIRWD